MAFHAGAWIAFSFGEIEESYKYCTCLLEQTKKSPCAFYTGFSMIFMGYYTALGGNAPKGITLIEEGFSHLSNEGGVLFHTFHAMILGCVHRDPCTIHCARARIGFLETTKKPS